MKNEAEETPAPPRAMRTHGAIPRLTAGMLALALLAGGYWSAWRAYSWYTDHHLNPFKPEPFWLPAVEAALGPAQRFDMLLWDWQDERSCRRTFSGTWTSADGKFTITTAYRDGILSVDPPDSLPPEPHPKRLQRYGGAGDPYYFHVPGALERELQFFEDHLSVTWLSVTWLSGMDEPSVVHESFVFRRQRDEE